MDGRGFDVRFFKYENKSLESIRANPAYVSHKYKLTNLNKSKMH